MPPQPDASTLTPDQLRTLQENRLKGKAQTPTTLVGN